MARAAAIAATVMRRRWRRRGWCPWARASQPCTKVGGSLGELALGRHLLLLGLRVGDVISGMEGISSLGAAGMEGISSLGASGKAGMEGSAGADDSSETRRGTQGTGWSEVLISHSPLWTTTRSEKEESSEAGEYLAGRASRRATFR